jgi:hypothetical protein
VAVTDATDNRATIARAVHEALHELFDGPVERAPNGVELSSRNADLPAGTTVVGHITDKVMEALDA